MEEVPAPDHIEALHKDNAKKGKQGQSHNSSVQCKGICYIVGIYVL